jgi:hypothetical protein
MSDPYGIVITSTKGQPMTNQELADTLRKKFIPFAFTCECKGADPDCAEVFASASMWTQRDTVERIAKFIESVGK